MAGNLVLDNGQDIGSSFTFIPKGYGGVSSDGGAALVANAGRYSLELADAFSGRRSSLTSAPSTRTASLMLRRQFGRQIQAFIDASTVENNGSSAGAGLPGFVTLPADNENNPFNTAIRVTFPGRRAWCTHRAVSRV